MTCSKFKHRTRREALDELKRFRSHPNRGHDVGSLCVYHCPDCSAYHIGRSNRGLREVRKTELMTKAEVKHLKNRLADAGRRIAKDLDRANQKRLAELASIVAEDREWLKRIEDARNFHAECTEALNRILDEHFAKLNSKSA